MIFKNSKMKNNIIIALLFVLLICTSAISVVLFDFNSDLQKQINSRDKLIENASHRDSIFITQTKNYTDTITKYLSDCSFKIDGKSVSTDELLDYINSLENETVLLRDTLNYRINNLINCNKTLQFYKRMYDTCFSEVKLLRDSVHINAKIIDIVKRDYGIIYEVQKTENKIYYNRNVFSKADSGLLLLKYFRSRIKRDSNSDTWLIDTH